MGMKRRVQSSAVALVAVSVLNREPMGMKPGGRILHKRRIMRFSAQPRADGDEAMS